MEASLDPLAVISLLGAAQGILFASALLGLKKGRGSANRLLAAFFAITSLAIIGSILVSTKYILIYPHLVQLTAPVHFLFGPLIFLYISLSTTRKSLRRLDLLHFLPFVLCAAYYVPLYFQSRAYKLHYSELLLQNYPPNELRIKSAVLVIQALPYLFLAAAKALSHSKRIKALNPCTGTKHLFWLRSLMVMAIVVAVAGLFRFFFNFRPETILLVPLCFSVMVYIAGYMALKHPDSLAGMDESMPVEGFKKYEKSNLTEQRAEEYVERLLRFMQSDKPYMSGDITLQKLAEKVSIPANHLSQIINERIGQNFFDFINSYRVKEVQRLFADPSKKHYSLLAIAEEVGFNSKSTFNSAFKKYSNMTPSEFRRASDDRTAGCNPG
jgi:AraC-like DNA-binding protein